MCTAFIRRLVASLKDEQMFTTRDCLKYGSRAAVDKALSRLVRSGVLLRLARGVFMKDKWKSPRPTAFEIATLKAQSFGRLIAPHGEDLGRELGLGTPAQPEPAFIISGSTSSFRYGDTVIHLKNACMRKHRAGESLAGHIIRALWHLGEVDCTRERVLTAVETCGRTTREELRNSAAWMPAWLSDFFVQRISLHRRKRQLAS